MQVDKDQRALEDVIMYDELAAMGTEIDTVKENVIRTLSDNELENILNDDSETEEMDTLITDSNIDAYGYFFEELHEKFDNHSRGIECSFRDLIFIGARAYGLKNKFFFICRLCNYKNFVWSEPSSEESLDVNIEAVAGAILTGAGYTQLRESCCLLDGNERMMLDSLRKGLVQSLDSLLVLRALNTEFTAGRSPSPLHKY